VGPFSFLDQIAGVDMIRESVLSGYSDTLIKMLSRKTGVSRKSLSIFYTWGNRGIVTTNNKEVAKAFQEIKRAVPEVILEYNKPSIMYRGITVSKDAVHALRQNNKPIELKPMVISTWTGSLSVAQHRLLDIKDDSVVGIVVRGNPSHILLPLTEKLYELLDPYNWSKRPMWKKGFVEVLCLSNGIQKIADHNIKSLIYGGKTYSLDEFQRMFTGPLQKRGVDWQRPPIDKHLDKFGKIVNKYGMTEDQIMKAFRSAQMIELTDNMWSHLKNTDSWTKVQKGDMQSMMRAVKENNKLATDLMNKMKLSQSITAPIILKTKGHYHVLLGNNVLRVAKALDVRPTVMLMDADAV
jgi:hypothetical protein